MVVLSPVLKEKWQLIVLNLAEKKIVSFNYFSNYNTAL